MLRPLAKRLLVSLISLVVAIVCSEVGFRILGSSVGVDQENLARYKRYVTRGGLAFEPRPHTGRTLILGRAIPPDLQRAVVSFLESQPSIEGVSDVKSRIVGAGRFKLKAEIDWNGRELAKGLEGWVEERADKLATAEGQTVKNHQFVRSIN